MQYSMIVKRDSDGMFVARVTELPECVAAGRTQKEALDNAKLAVESHLKCLKMDAPILRTK